MKTLQALLVAGVLAVVGSYVLFAQQGGSQMTFFITSTGVGNGGNLGGLAGADKHCQTLAAAAGAGNRKWQAYLSTQGAGAVNARDRIGKGPWTNAKGAVVAKGLDDLHSASNNLTKETQLTEKGGVVNGRGDTPNTHDIMTGSNADGTAVPGGHRQHVQQLDECGGNGRRRPRRPSRSAGRRPGSDLVELCAHDARLFAGQSREGRRSGTLLLLCRELGQVGRVRQVRHR